MVSQLSGILVIVVTLIMCNVITSMETAAYKAVRPIIVTQTKIAARIEDHQPTKAEKKEQEANDKAIAQVEILRNSFLMLWICGGILPGSVVGAILRQVSKQRLFLDMSLSVCTALPLTPYLLKQYTDSTPEACFLGGFVVAVSSWSAWTIALIMVARITKATEKGGVGGILDEVRGNGGKT